jgi:hypothetical protein
MTHSHHDPSYWTRHHSEAVVLDIGDDIGALVLYTRPELHGSEIEVSPRGNPGARVHSAVLEREVSGRTVFAAVYPELRPGCYDVWSEPPGQVTIAAGTVSEVRIDNYGSEPSATR